MGSEIFSLINARHSKPPRADMGKFSVGIVCVIVVLACVASFVGHPAQSTPPQQSQPNIERTAIVAGVVDGDTISLQSGEMVRLVGVNAPEIHPEEEGGMEAKEFTASLCPPGTEVGLDVDDLDQTDHYGRTIAVVYVEVDGSWVNLNAELLRSGCAEVMFIPPSEFNPYRWMC